MRVQVNTRSSSRDYAASAILSLALLLLLFGDRISKIGVPWGASDMTMYYNLVRYWNFWGFSRAEDMAFPLGADPNLFSGDAVISYAFGSLIYAISGNPFAGINLLFLLSFPVVSVLALACIRSVGLKGPWAIVLSVSFSFIPFHIWRGLQHIHLSLLFGATAGMLIVLLVMKGTWKEWTEGKPTATSRWRIIGVGALVLVAAWTSLYFAVFSSVLLLAAVVWRWTRGDGTATLFRALALPLSAIAAIALSLLPALLARQQTPGGTSVATREPLESVTYAGNLFVAILPAPIVKQFEAYNQFIFTNLQDWPDRNESMWLSNYGTWISVMCLGIFIFGLGWSARRRQRPNAFSNRPSPSENFSTHRTCLPGRRDAPLLRSLGPKFSFCSRPIRSNSGLEPFCSDSHLALYPWSSCLPEQMALAAQPPRQHYRCTGRGSSHRLHPSATSQCTRKGLRGWRRKSSQCCI